MSSVPNFSSRETSHVDVVRLRGSSMSNVSSVPSRQVSVNSAPTKSGEDSEKVVLAVIGTAGCGKSTVIRKGLRSGFNMQEVPYEQGRSLEAGLPPITLRVGVVLEEPTLPNPRPLEVYEVRVDGGGLISLQNLPKLDGVMICYDTTDETSYIPVESILMHYRIKGLSRMVLACKSDLDHIVDPSETLNMLKPYDTGLIEVSNATESGREKMKQAFKYMLKGVVRERGSAKSGSESNPASPSLLQKGAPWSEQENVEQQPSQMPSQPAPIVDGLSVDTAKVTESSSVQDRSDDTPSTTARSPTWAHPTSEPSVNTELQSMPIKNLEMSMSGLEDSNQEQLDYAEHSPEFIDDATQLVVNKRKNPSDERQSNRYVELEAILDKLLFMAVSGEDPTFVTHFLLTYRRFTTPRSVLLAMQKRMRMLDNPCGDPMFACFAQMRICHFLEIWIRDFPYDFAVPGTAGALNALIKSIISKTHLLHYGSELLPFLEQLPNLVDQDAAWAVKGEISEHDSDDSDDEEEDLLVGQAPTPEVEPEPAPASHSPKVVFPTRERKSSIPLPKSILHSSQSSPAQNVQEQSPKQYIKDLVKIAGDILLMDSTEIAEEVTRTGLKQFMAIKPRDWLHYTFITKGGKGNPTDNDPIVTFNIMSNHLADWVVSLILSHERPRQRARQIEKFVDIATKLRSLNNYAGLRAFLSGINVAMDMDVPTSTYLKEKSSDVTKNIKSWDVLLQQTRAHRAYRMALRNTKGSCIPAMEVHMSDLLKSQETNSDFSSEDPSLIHWAKFNLMGRFITTTVQCQVQCRNSTDYDFIERPHIAELFVKRPVMSYEMQQSRLKLDDDGDDDTKTNTQPPQDLGQLRRIFFT
ncbi:ras GEF [Agrocybe pediades]|nr:ras GEF [Agrocybe pediades]